MNKYISPIHQSRIQRGFLWRRLGSVLAMIIFGGALFLMPLTVRAEESVHIVHRGESLGMIAQQHGVSVHDLIRYNELSNPNILLAGQRIRIPDEDAILAAEAAEIVASAASEEEIESEVAEAVEIAEVTEIAEIAEIADSAVGAVTDDSSAAEAAAEIEEKLALADILPGDNGYYYVRRSESLSGIAKSFGMTLQDIMRLNDISDPNLLRVGQQLRISVRAPDLDGMERAEPTQASAIHTVQGSETLSEIASKYGTTVRELMAGNGLPNEQFLHPGQRLRIQSKVPRSIINMDAAPVDGDRWIEVNLADQTLTAWQGDVPVLQTTVSTGKASTPTVTGRFDIYNKYSLQRMSGDDYNIPNVPSVMYFHRGFAIHGAYWNPPFGTPSSHGCVNVRPSEAALLFDWADAGTEVWVHK